METRTDEDKLVERGVKVTLGGREYEARPKKTRAALAWQQKFLKKATGLKRLGGLPWVKPGERLDLAALDTQEDVTLAVMVEAIFSKIQWESAIEGMQIVIGEHGVDLWDLTLDYLDLSDEDRQRIEDHASLEESMTAIWEVVRLGFPLDRMIKLAIERVGKTGAGAGAEMEKNGSGT